MAYDRDSSKSEDIEPKTTGLFSDKKMIIVLVLSIFVSVALSTITTVIIMPNSAQVLTQETFSQSIERMGEIEELIQQQTELATKLEVNYDALQTHLRHSSSKALKNILLDQEKNFQSFLTVFKAGMRDLALEVPDGLNWYNDYSEQMERSLQHSLQRSSVLSKLRVGEVQEITTESITTPIDLESESN